MRRSRRAARHRGSTAAANAVPGKRGRCTVPGTYGRFHGVARRHTNQGVGPRAARVGERVCARLARRCRGVGVFVATVVSVVVTQTYSMPMLRSISHKPAHGDARLHTTTHGSPAPGAPRAQSRDGTVWEPTYPRRHHPLSATRATHGRCETAARCSRPRRRPSSSTSSPVGGGSGSDGSPLGGRGAAI